MDAERRLTELGIVLPKAAAPVGAYLKAVRSGDLLFLSGHGPHQDGVVPFKGKVGRDLSLEEGYVAARLTMLNCLTTIRNELDTLDRVRRVVKVLGFVNSAPGFTDQPKVINGGSELLIELFGDAGKHARSAVGIAELPGDIAVEIEMVVEIAD